jgi:tetratricopeptide (TPR) repeat protein
MMSRLMTVVALAVSFALVGCAKKQTVPAVDPGVQMFEDGKFEEARTYYEGVLARDTTDVDAMLYLGRIDLNQQDYDGAIDWMERALEIAPDSSNVHYWAATAYVAKLQNEQAYMLIDKVRTHIEKAVELNPANVDARMFLAGFYMQAPPMVGGSMDKAREQAQLILEYDEFRGRMFMAELHKHEKKFDEAAAAYEAASRADPTSAAPYYSLGMMYQANEAYEDAFAAFEKAVEVDPGATHALYQIGRTGAMSETNLDRAIECLQMYLQNKPARGAPTWANAHWRLGMLYDIKGDKAAARKEFEAALALDPDDENAKEALEKLNAGEKETPESEQ